MKKTYDCGIDLGTTNSCIAVPNNDNTCRLIDNINDRMQVTPSAVWIKGGRMIIGRKAYESPFADNIRREFKRDMGTDTVYKFADIDRDLTPVDLSAEILKSLKKDAEQRENKPMQDAVITVPAAFTVVQCEATGKAAKAAGFRSVILLQEPIAAAIAYGAKPDAKDQYWLVFDYGGGTFDVSVISTHDGRLETITSMGDNYKGGKDIDRLLLENVILPRLNKKYNLQGTITNSTHRKLMLAAEQCKIALSFSDEADFTLFDDTADNDGVIIDADFCVTRAEFEAAVKSEIDSAVETARAALSASKVSDSEINKIILVGGTTFIPMVKDRLREEFDITIDSALNPMTVVAEGAALYAAVMSLESSDTVTLQKKDDEYPLELEYEYITSAREINVLGKIIGAGGAAARVRIDCIANENAQSALWTSGWCDMLDEAGGIFDINVKIINNNAKNLYKTQAETKTGSALALTGYLFEILHNDTALIPTAPPLNNKIGIKVTDGTDNYIDWFIEKDTKLPVKSKPISYELNKTLDPGDDAEFEIYIYEGDNTLIPEANDLVRKVVIRSYDLERTLEAGTVLELTIEIDESRNAALRIYAPLYDYELPEQRIARSESGYKNYNAEMEIAESKFIEAEYTLNMLREKGTDIRELDKELTEQKQKFDTYYDLIDIKNDEVHQYIKAFYAFLSKIVAAERQSRNRIQEQSNSSELDRIKRNISIYGDAEQKKALETLEEQLESVKSADSRKIILDRMSGLETVAVYSSFDWLHSAYSIIHANANNYKNTEKAGYWKNEAQKAINAKDAQALLNCVNQLNNLKIETIGNTVNKVLADLKSANGLKPE